MGQIRGFFRSDFSAFGAGAPNALKSDLKKIQDLSNLGSIWPTLEPNLPSPCFGKVVRRCNLPCSQWLDGVIRPDSRPTDHQLLYNHTLPDHYYFWLVKWEAGRLDYAAFVFRWGDLAMCLYHFNACFVVIAVYLDIEKSYSARWLKLDRATSDVS